MFKFEFCIFSVTVINPFQFPYCLYLDTGKQPRSMIRRSSLIVFHLHLLITGSIVAKAQDEDPQMKLQSNNPSPAQTTEDMIMKEFDEDTSNVLISETTSSPPEDMNTYEVPIQTVAKKKTLSSRLASFSTIHDENATYLDIFGEVSKDYIIHHLIPPTDAECDWNWSHLRCEPFCNCDYVYQFGDYHLGRSCRLRRSGEFFGTDQMI